MAGGALQSCSDYVNCASPPSGAWQRRAIAVSDQIASSVIGQPQLHARPAHLDLQSYSWEHDRCIPSRRFSRVIHCEYEGAIDQLRDCPMSMHLDCSRAIVSIGAQGGIGNEGGVAVGPRSRAPAT